MTNPLGYLYRVGTSRSRRLMRWRHEQGRLPTEITSRQGDTWIEPKLPEALNRLRLEERTAIVLVHCFQWTYAEVADLLDVPIHTVRNRIHRGLKTLRAQLGVGDV